MNRGRAKGKAAGRAQRSGSSRSQAPAKKAADRFAQDVFSDSAGAVPSQTAAVLIFLCGGSSDPETRDTSTHKKFLPDEPDLPWLFAGYPTPFCETWNPMRWRSSVLFAPRQSVRPRP